MRRLLLVLCVPAVLFAEPPKVDIPSMDFKPAQAEQVTLSNGVKVYLREDHELPILDLSIRMKTSPADEVVPDAFTFLSDVWRTGGTLRRTPEQLNEELEFLPASVETSIDNETASVSLSCLSTQWAASLDLWADVLLNPAFNADQLQLSKAKALEGLKRKNETPPQIARRLFRDVTFGNDHVYAYEPTEKNVAAVTRAHLVALHKKVIAPDTAMIAVAGDFNQTALLTALEEKLKNWKPAGRFVPAYDFSVKKSTPGSVFFVEKDASQSRITIGRISPPRHNPDYFSLALADYILGSGGPSRLFGEIRSRLGLAYVVGSFVLEMKGPGLVGVACQTKSQSTIAAVKAIWNEMDKFAAGPINDREIRLAKDSLVNSYVFGFDSPWETVNSRMGSDFYGYAADYVDTYTKRLETTTKEQIQKSAKKYFSRENSKIVIVGKEKALDAPLSDLGTVVRIPLKDIN